MNQYEQQNCNTKNVTEKMIRFYRELSKIFYAVAASDKTIHTKETLVLKKIVQQEWLNWDDTSDSFGTDSAYQIKIVFDWLLENELQIKRHEHDVLKRLEKILNA